MAKTQAKTKIKTKTPLVSVLIPAHNAEKFISCALDSVLGQTYSNLEVIVVDDGSTDQTAKVIAKFMKKDKRISTCRKESCDLPTIRNILFAAAKGKYYHFLDADDWLDKNYYEECVKVAEETGADLCVTGFKTDRWGGHPSIHYNELCVVSDLREKVVAIGGLPLRSMVWRYLFRADFVKRTDLKFVEGCYIEDLKFTPVALAESDKMAVVPHVLYHYIDNPSSITANKNKKKFRADHKDAKRTLKRLDKKYKLSGLFMRNFVKEAFIRDYKLFCRLTWLRRRDYNTSRIWFLFRLIPLWRRSKK